MFPSSFPSAELPISEMRLPWMDCLLHDDSESSTDSSSCASPVMADIDAAAAPLDFSPQQQPLQLPPAHVPDPTELEALINRMLVDVSLKMSGCERLPETSFGTPARDWGGCTRHKNHPPRQKQNVSSRRRSDRSRRSSRFSGLDQPRHQQTPVAAEIGPTPQGGLTTWMMRNVPNRYTQGELMQEISFSGFEGKFDFFYLPIDRVSMANAGYCFINFTTAEYASEFFDSFAGRVLGRFGSRKVVEVVPAAIQGFYQNLSHYSKKVVATEDNPELRPIFLVNGRPVKFARPGGLHGCTESQNGLEPAVLREHDYATRHRQRVTASALVREEVASIGMEAFAPSTRLIGGVPAS
ncbi:hypothetical protein FOZ62_024894 [Perkinsus olseni]|uniref:Mei2-like C-terminal RNA recognition motif domain-containing protein n=1 Tax=Perkinsus olseni TaxID=32597 RepID=A0A7J6SAK6_PEROL|nr:hypothetical protein FOZ62_024894 [Perkinsus olseni]